MKRSFRVGDSVVLRYFNNKFHFGDTGEMDGKIGIIDSIEYGKLYVKLTGKRTCVTVLPEECLVLGTTSGATTFEFDIPEQQSSSKEIIVTKDKTVTLLSNSTTLTINQNF